MSGELAGMRIVVVNNFPGPGLGGGEVQVSAVVDGFMRAGADVHAVVVPGSGFGTALQKRGVTVVETPLTPSALSTAVRTIASELPADQACVALGTGYWTNLLVRLAARGGDAAVVNLVGVTPGASLVDGGSGLGLAVRQLVDRATAGGVGAYVAVAQAVADGLVAQGAPADRVHVIPNGVDATALRAIAADAQADSRFASQIPPGRPLVVCAARLEPVKGVDVLVRAAALAPGVTFAIAGDGPQEGALRELAVALSASNRIVFLGRVAPIAPLLAAADVVVLPSRSEGMPIVALEAMALGRPVIASRVGGVPEVVSDGETGLLVPADDPLALARAIVELTSDPAEAAAMGAAGASRVDERFSARAMSDAYVQLVAGIIAKPA